jgi:hypothetical protein
MPTPTVTPTPTLTPTSTPVPLVVGDKWTGTDGLKTLVMLRRIVPFDFACFFVEYRTAIGFEFDFMNNAEEIYLRYKAQDFSLVDNMGRGYSCFFPCAEENQDVRLGTGDTHFFRVACGDRKRLDEKVDYVVLTVKDFSTLGSQSWRIDIPH